MERTQTSSQALSSLLLRKDVVIGFMKHCACHVALKCDLLSIAEKFGFVTSLIWRCLERSKTDSVEMLASERDPNSHQRRYYSTWILKKILNHQKICMGALLSLFCLTFIYNHERKKRNVQGEKWFKKKDYVTIGF